MPTFGWPSLGRPNVGKSMLLNALTGENRSIVSDVPGTTRDTIDTLINYRDKDILLIDTAGIRRRGKIGTGIEKYSVIRSVRAIDRADVGDPADGCDGTRHLTGHSCGGIHPGQLQGLCDGCQQVGLARR